MKIISKGLGEGKTYDLVKLMLEPGNEDVVFVAPTRAQAQALGKRTAVETFGQGDTPELSQRFISAAELPNRKGRKERYVIDEIDGVIGGLMGGEVIAIAGTDEDVKAEHRKRRAESPHPPQGAGVKADSKGRLTGAQPETRYLKRTDPDGTLVFQPVRHRPSEHENTIVVDAPPGRQRGVRITLEVSGRDFKEVEQLVQKVAEVSGSKEVWVETTGVFGTLYDMLKGGESGFELYGFTPSAKDFEDWRKES